MRRVSVAGGRAVGGDARSELAPELPAFHWLCDGLFSSLFCSRFSSLFSSGRSLLPALLPACLIGSVSADSAMAWVSAGRGSVVYGPLVSGRWGPGFAAGGSGRAGTTRRSLGKRGCINVKEQS